MILKILTGWCGLKWGLELCRKETETPNVFYTQTMSLRDCCESGILGGVDFLWVSQGKILCSFCEQSLWYSRVISSCDILTLLSTSYPGELDHHALFVTSWCFGTIPTRVSILFCWAGRGSKPSLGHKYAPTNKEQLRIQEVTERKLTEQNAALPAPPSHCHAAKL